MRPITIDFARENDIIDITSYNYRKKHNDIAKVGHGMKTKVSSRITAWLISATTVVSASALSFSVSLSAVAGTVSGTSPKTSKTLYDGVSYDYYELPSSSTYGAKDFSVVEFDLAQRDLYLDVVSAGTYSNQLLQTSKILSNFNSKNDEGKTAIAAINGDLWMANYCHSRTKDTEYNGVVYGPVVKKTLTLPRGFNVSDGEIITSACIPEETPYESDFYTFGVTDDYVPFMCNPGTGITVTNNTRKTEFYTEALNRLPVENATVVYTDKGCLNNYALDDAYEVMVDVSYDYKVAHGCSITGTVSGIYGPSDSENPTMKANRIILTARGSSQISNLSSYRVGDTVSISVNTYDKWGHYTDLLHRIAEGVGGHIPLVIDGEAFNSGLNNLYATSIIGYTSTGSIKLLTLDSISSTSSSKYFRISDMPALCKELDIVNAFLLDGGGSATMVTLDGGSYKLQGTPSDGSERAVVNAIILSHGPEREAQGSFTPQPTYNDDLSKLRFTSPEMMKYFLQQTPLKAEKLVSLGYSETENALEINTVTDYDPYFYIDYSKSSVSFSADDCKYAVLTYKNPTSNSDKAVKASFFPCAGSITAASPECTVAVDLPQSDAYQSTVIDLSGLSKWSGNVNAMRWDFFDEASIGDRLYVKSLIFCATEAEANAVAANEKNNANISFGSEQMLRHTPVIDGKLDDAYKASCGVIMNNTDIKHALTGKPLSDVLLNKYTGDMWAAAYFLYDSDYIYAFVTVHDSTLMPMTEITEKNAHRNNNAFVSVWDGAEWPGSSAEVLLNATNGYAYATGSSGGYGSNFAAAYGTDTPSTEYAYSLNPGGDGYVVEARIYAPGYKQGDTVSVALGANDFVSGNYNFYRFGNIYAKDNGADFDATVTLGDSYEKHTHTWQTDYTVDVPATCTQTGSKSIHCSGCDEIKPGSEVTIPMTAHSYVLSSSVAATCTQAGSNTYSCSVCSRKDVRNTPALGHSYGTDGVCTRCGAKEKPSLSVYTESGALKAGDTLTFTLSLSDCTSLKSLRVKPVFDSSVFEIVSMCWLIGGTSISDTSGGIAVAAFAAETADVNGDILECELKVKEGVSAGEYSVGFDVVLKSKASGVETALDITQPEAWTVTVEPEHVHDYEYTCAPNQTQTNYRKGHIGTCKVCQDVTELIAHTPDELGICSVCGGNVNLIMSRYSVSLADVLTLNIKIDKTNVEAYDSFYVKFVDHFNGTEIVDTVEGYELEGTRYVFKYGTPPQRAIDDIDVYVCGVKNGETYTGTYRTLNIKDYIYDELNTISDNSLKRVYVHLLDYIAEAQRVVDYNVNSLANAELTEEWKSLRLPEDKNYTKIAGTRVNEGTSGVTYKTRSLYCSDAVSFKYNFIINDAKYNPDNIKVVVKFAEDGRIMKEYTGSDIIYDSVNDRHYVIVGLIAQHMSKALEVNVYTLDGTLLTNKTLTNSIESMVAEEDKGVLTDMLDAMMQYGRAAAKYVNG